ncbi:right-handed parallel beta-helix repeat-containing protein [Methanocrinis sp.]|uniref:right-handed parallel beta-helix repeat-containing protein n=1 Tax=Methanocrinis sp. TaxID=3101522 RepID=UPI003D0AD732
MILALTGTAFCEAISASGDVQEAIARARPGDTVIVRAGDYEPFTVDKPLIIQGVGYPSAQARIQEPAITIRAHGVVLRGFEVEGVPRNQDDKFRYYMELSSQRAQTTLNQPNSGVLVDGDDVVIEDMAVMGSEVGILLKDARNFTIQNSSFARCNSGLSIQGCDGGKVEGCTFQGCDKYGAYLEGCEEIFIRENEAVGNSGVGMMLKGSSCAVVEGNEFVENWQGLFLWNSSLCEIRENRADRNVYYGMVIASGSNNSILNNLARKTGGGELNLLGIGISIQENSTYNLVAGNVLEENLNGLDLTRGCRFNLILSNEMSENSNGIRLDKNENNLVYKNNFRRNLITGYDNASHNFWNATVGNYYDDYRGRDRDGDGIGEDPYWIPKGSSCTVDWRPLMQPAEMVIDLEAAWGDLARYATYEPEEDLPYKIEDEIIVIGREEPEKWWI